MRRAAISPVIIGSLASALVVLAFYIIILQNLNSKSEELDRTKINLAQTLASKAELRMKSAASLLEVTAKLPQVQNNSFSNLISVESKGIPVGADPEKRAIQKSMLSAQAFESSSFLMPNGDVYSVEPSSQQKNLPVVNFAYREYFSKVTSLQSTYVSDVFRSAATNHNTVVVTTPVFKDGIETGIWLGAMDLSAINEQLRGLNLGPNEVAVIVDQNGNEIASSDKRQDTQVKALSYSYLDSVGKVFAGNTGTGVQSVNGTQIHSAYAPIELPGNKWAVLVIQPVADASSDLYLNQREALVIVSIVVSIMVISGYFLFRSDVRNNLLTKNLERANDELKKVNNDLNRKADHLEHLTADLKAGAEKLREIDTSKEEFSSMITHELRTPLVPIIGYGDLLLGGRIGELTKIQKEKVHIMHENAQRLSKLIQDVLDVRKLDLGRMKLELHEMSSAELLARTINAFKLEAEKKGVKLESTITVEKDQDLLRVKCDPDRIQQVLGNLISNALKFVPARWGKIEVNAQRSLHGGGSVVFSVKDNGIGIPEENQRKLFTKFYQVDTSSTRRTGGTGLGLAISRGIVEAHGGKLWVQSVETKGSLFMFSIPTGDSGK